MSPIITLRNPAAISGVEVVRQLRQSRPGHEKEFHLIGECFAQGDSFHVE
jgi:hypothetical protein